MITGDLLLRTMASCATLVVLLICVHGCVADDSDVQNCKYTSDSGDVYDLSPLIPAE